MPTSGVTPSNPGVAVNIAGLTAGTYYDTITVSAPNATNTPQYVPVTLNVAEPPPVIQLVPDEFYFVAMQDSANPESPRRSRSGATTRARLPRRRAIAQ